MSRPSNKTESLIVRLLSCAFITVLTAAYLKFHSATHIPENLSSSAEHLLQGHTHWITFQNRLLSPALVSVIQLVTGLPWLRSFQILIILCMGGGAGVLLWRSWKYTGKSALGLRESILWFALAFLFNHTWSYPWDYTGAVLFLLVMVWAKDCFHSLADLKSWRLGVLLVLLALNRESSLIILAGLILTAFLLGFYEKKWSHAFKTILVLSLAGLTNLIGVIYIRHALFKIPTRPIGVEGPETAVGNFNQVTSNLRNMIHIHNGYQLGGTVIVILMVITSSCLLWITVRKVYRLIPIAPGVIFIRSCLLATSASIVIFADMTELRVYFELIPIFILLALESRSRAEARMPYGAVSIR